MSQIADWLNYGKITQTFQHYTLKFRNSQDTIKKIKIYEQILKTQA